MKKPKKKSGIAEGYVHGFTKDEQDRLYRQARFLEPSVYQLIDFKKQRDVLEVGCGVGAQTEILLEKFPDLRITGVDASKTQVERAKKQLAREIKKGRANFQVGDALSLPFGENRFDGAFVCWLLEHVQSPIEILAEIRRTLKPGGVIYCSEVMNSTFFVHPYSPNTLKYWFVFNDHQWELKGDPFVGAKLANYLLAAGYQNVKTDVRVYHLDNRAPKRRAEFIDYWTELLLSGAPGLLKAGKVNRATVEGMRQELETLKNDPDAVFFYAWVQARAEVF